MSQPKPSTFPKGDPSHATLGSYRILRLPAVLEARGRSRSAHYGDIAMGLFTRQVTLGARCVGWPEAEVVALNQARIAGLNEDGIRALVTRLESLRQERGGDTPLTVNTT